MIKRGCLLVAVAAFLACQAGPSGFLAIDGWSAHGEAETYDAAGLWELINGAADTFLAFGFESVTVQNYAAGEVVATVSAYDMGTPLNAFGIYRTEAPPDQEPLQVGVEAVVSPPYQYLLLKDRYYVKVDAYEGDIEEAAGEALLEAISKVLPGSDSLPAEFDSLPVEGMVPGSARYTKKAFLGLAELDECVHASYRDEAGGEYRLFAVLPITADYLESTWTDLSAKWAQMDLGGEPVLYREIPYSGFVGIRRIDGALMGVDNCADQEVLAQRLTGL